MPHSTSTTVGQRVTEPRRVNPPFPFAMMILLLSAVLLIPGCIGGATHRNGDGASTTELSHWVFPLYHYSERGEERTLTPFFLVPIALGGPAEEAEVETISSERPDTMLDLPPADAPAWSWTAEADSTEPGRSDPTSLTSADHRLVGKGVPGEVAFEHEVQAGETLFAIARHYYGTGSRWPEIIEANLDRVASPQQLSVGVKLRIP